MKAKEEQWIPVGKSLPDYNVEVLVYGRRIQTNPQMGGNHPVVTISQRHDLKNTGLARDRRRYQDENEFRLMMEVTHWMPLPSPPGTEFVGFGDV